MRLERLFGLMEDRRVDRAIAEGEAGHSYGDLIAAMDEADDLIALHHIGPGDVIGLQSDFRFRAIALALALFRRKCIVAFLSPKADVEAALADCAATGAFRFLDGTPSFYRPARGPTAADRGNRTPHRVCRGSQRIATMNLRRSACRDRGRSFREAAPSATACRASTSPRVAASRPAASWRPAPPQA